LSGLRLWLYLLRPLAAGEFPAEGGSRGALLHPGFGAGYYALLRGGGKLSVFWQQRFLSLWRVTRPAGFIRRQPCRFVDGS